ncbi:MAG: sodium:solute symporter family protein [Azoarcus sp.]|jgi:Na+/proline symporter|nr:sodium:solute symporter family protein [Azoarcus sp.]
MLLKLVVAYLVVSIGIGLFAAARVHNARDYITAGRHLPMSVVLAMVFATWFGAETVLGNSGTFLKDGASGLISDPLGAGMCLMLFGLVFARPLYRMNLLTLGDFFRRRYNRGIELALSTCIVLSYLGWVGAQIAALGLVFDLLSSGVVDQRTGMMIGAAVVVFYTLLGGMWSVAVTTFVQMIVIVLGLLYVTWIASDMAGGVAVVVEHATAAGKFDLLRGTSARDIFTWVAAFLTMALGSVPQQDVFQRVNSSGDERTAVWGTTLGGFSYIIFAMVPIYLAYTAQIVDPEMVARVSTDDTQKIMPVLVMNHMSTATQVIFFGALLSVIMSTASGTLLAPSVTFSENVLRGFFPRMTDYQFLWASRATVIGFSLLVTWYALNTDASIHEMVERAYRITLAGAFVPLVAGIFWKRANSLGGTLAVGLGLATWLAGEYLIHIGMLSDILQPQVYGLAASAAGMVVGVIFGARPADAPPSEDPGRSAIAASPCGSES